MTQRIFCEVNEQGYRTAVMAKIRKLIQEPVIEVFNSAIEELLSEYPNATKWFEWWLRDAVARLIFACKSCTDKEFEEMARSDSNPIESMHSTFNQIADRKNSLVYGMSILTMFSKSLRQDFEDVASGVTVHYGQAERWKRQIDKYARKAPVVVRNRKLANDGRAPDTSKELVGPDNIVKAKLGRPKGSRNIDRNALTTYQSYSHDNNTCYITSLLECLFACFQVCPMNAMLFSGCYELFLKMIGHFQLRSEASSHTNITGLLKSGLSQLVQFVVHDRKLFRSGQFGNPATVFQALFQVNDHSDFCTFLHRSLFCDAGHENSYSERSLPIIEISALVVAQLGDNLPDILNRWSTTGIDDWIPMGCNCCHLKVIHCRTKVKLSNKVLFIELGMDIESEQLRCPETMSVDGRDWQLMGRIYSSKDWGCHFFAIVRRNDVPLKGFYIYDDLVNSGRAMYHSLNLPEQCNLSRYLFYTLQQGTDETVDNLNSFVAITKPEGKANTAVVAKVCKRRS